MKGRRHKDHSSVSSFPDETRETLGFGPCSEVSLFDSDKFNRVGRYAEGVEVLHHPLVNRQVAAQSGTEWHQCLLAQHQHARCPAISDQLGSGLKFGLEAILSSTQDIHHIVVS